MRWCEVHHICLWENNGETKLENCAMLCRVHHRLLHPPADAITVRREPP
ncbi:MAG: HNH endonuclease signature motif containing protein [Pseudonocardia sp.]